MHFQRICWAAAMLSWLFGLGFVLTPDESIGLYGVRLVDPGSVVLARYFGATLVLYGSAAFGLTVLQDGGSQRRAARALALATAIGLVVTVAATMAGTINALGWSSVALYGLFTLGWLACSR